MIAKPKAPNPRVAHVRPSTRVHRRARADVAGRGSCAPHPPHRHSGQRTGDESRFSVSRFGFSRFDFVFRFLGRFLPLMHIVLKFRSKSQQFCSTCTEPRFRILQRKSQANSISHTLYLHVRARPRLVGDSDKRHASRLPWPCPCRLVPVDDIASVTQGHGRPLLPWSPLASTTVFGDFSPTALRPDRVMDGGYVRIE